MKERGQVFTTDMIFALLLTTALISISGQAYALASGQMKSYSTRYSLERVANDAADILVKSSGRPTHWGNQFGNLKTLGLAEVGSDNEPISNYIDSHKLTLLASKICGDNWNPEKEKMDKAIKEFFGTSKFEIVFLKDENIVSRIWPGWNSGEEAKSENATEIAVAERYVYGSLLHIAGESPPLKHDVTVPATEPDNILFWIYPGELEAYNWYLYVENLSELNGNPVQIAINGGAAPGQGDYKFKEKGGIDIPSWAPEEDEYEGIEDDPDVKNNLVENELNYANIWVQGDPKVETVKVYIVAIPENTSPTEISRMMKKEPYTLRVKVWR